MEFKGLTDDEVIESRKKYGSNKIPESKPVSFLKKFFETLSDPMMKVLSAISIIMLVMCFFGYSEIYEAVGIIIAILLVCLITAKTECASDKKYRTLKQSTRNEKCKVYRNSKICEIDIDDVVVGDKVLLQSGDKIIADGLLVDGELKVNNAQLNGETEECLKTPCDINCEFPTTLAGETIVDSHTLFRGSVVYEGNAVMDTRCTGLDTLVGKMALDMQESQVPSPLKTKLSKLAKTISKVGYISAFVITICYFLLTVQQGGGFANYFSQEIGIVLKGIIHSLSLAVAIVVCAVPEGLPLMISLVLMQNTSKMLDKNVLIRKAEGIETAGSLNILFSDKTGTITKGKLEVIDLILGNGRSVSLSSISQSLHNKVMLSICKNTSSLFDEGKNVVGGNLTDKALLNFAGYETFQEYTSVNATCFQAFNSNNKFSQVEVDNKTYYKGAPEKLLNVSKNYYGPNCELLPIDINAISEKINLLAKKSIRVIVLAESGEKMVNDVICKDLNIIAIVAIRDEVRREAKQAISEVQKAGVQVVMITGDRADTALAIAKDAGIVKSESDISLTSAELNLMSDDEVKAIIPNLRVVSRALPLDKSRLVRLCQEMKLVVGMTGDGVNDAPALKKADVGFALGSGTEAAKEASKIVILDDNFRSIKDALLFGRTIYHNILKFCMFQLAINFTAVVVSAIAPFFGLSEPLKVTHLLFVNLIMDGFGASMLGNEGVKDEYMLEPPRRRDESLISKKMFIRILSTSIYFIAVSFLYLFLPFFRNMFQTQEQHLTSYFVLFIWMALFNGFNVRDDGFKIFSNLDDNKSFLRVFFSIVLIQAGIVYSQTIPYLSGIAKLFSCTAFELENYIFVILISFTIVLFDLFRKLVGKKIHKV